MARRSGSKAYLGFPKGLNTETSRIQPVEGTTADELNMDLRLNKLIRARRLGLENVGTNQATAGNIIGSHYWRSADTFVVVALEDNDPETYDTVTLYFYQGDLTYIEEWTVRVLDGKGVYPNFSEIRNRLVMTFGAKPFVFAKQGSGCFDGWVLDLFIRDFKLLDDGLRIGERPATLSDEHKYNLYNAGWYRERITTVSDPNEGDPVDDFFTSESEYPSNADIVYLGDVPNANSVPVFNPDVLDNLDVGNTEAPRGHYVYNIREIDRDAKLTDKDNDGTPTSTITKVLDCSTNISGNAGNLLYTDVQPTGESSDPTPPSGGGGAGGADPFNPTDYRQIE